MEKSLYYRKHENRTPYLPQKFSLWRTILFQFFSVLFIAVGASYLSWRWAFSLNPDALVFSVILVLAETLMFIGSLLMIINYWSPKTIHKKTPVHNNSEIFSNNNPDEKIRPLKIDVFIATYNEERALVEDTIRDAKKLNYPFQDVEIKIYLCDDGRRDGRDPEKENFKQLAKEYGIEYFVRENNKGFKAGNLNHAFWQTNGDLIVILDADTRVFPDFLTHLTGYFRDEKMAWVQSPQWFYDITEGMKLSDIIKSKLHSAGSFITRIIPFADNITIGKNILGTDPKFFYDSILRYRNAANAAFCCGAGSVHRRFALEELIKNQSKRLVELSSTISFDTSKAKHRELLKYCQLKNTTTGPFVHHISEDIYTSILLHSDKNKWKSYQHPDVECKMLSPQTLSGYIKQFSRYAEGTFLLFFSKENPLIKKGLGFRQRLAYFETIYSYFSPFWIIIFLLSPIVFFFTLDPPIKAFNFDFFLRFLIFNILNVIIITVGNWGFSTKRSEQYYLGAFWYKLKAFIKVISGGKVQFNPTLKGLQNETILQNMQFVWPHLLLVFLTFAGFLYNLILIINNQHPSYSAFFANSIWAFYNTYQINPIIRAAFKKQQ